VEVLKLKGYGDISRQTVSKYFNKISQFIWDVMIVGTDPLYENKDRLDELLQYMYGERDEIPSRYDVAYKFLQSTPAKAKTPNIQVQRTLMYYLLEKRSKVLKGFPKGKFYLEFSRVFYVCTMVEALGVDVKNHESFFKKETKDKMDLKMGKCLLDIFEKAPL